MNLIWSLQALHNEPHIESILAESLAKGAWYEMQGDYDAFGALWRLTGGFIRSIDNTLTLKEFKEDSLLPGFRLKVPMFIVLDTLKSPDVNVRRVGETWMRCYMKSYLRYAFRLPRNNQ